tara:strand:+ start:871 stop:1098 length:228 start_codon:yes stop_codon:yes gene_type:complete
MYKNFFHNNKSLNEKKVEKKYPQVSNIGTKEAVDINILLNRVRIEEKNEIKRKIIFFCLTMLTLGLFTTFIVILK